MGTLLLPASPWRRIAAGFYDLLLLLGLWIGLAFSLVVVRDGQPAPPGDPLLRAGIMFLSLGFYGWFWTHGGQTLGMRAWRLQVRRVDDGKISWLQVLTRFAVAIPAWTCAGLGIWWSLLDPQRRAWHDWASATVTVVLPKPAPDQ